MANPDDLEQEAQEQEAEAQREQQIAGALVSSGDPGQESDAQQHESVAALLYVRAKRERKVAQKVRGEIEEINRQIGQLQSRIDTLANERQQRLKELMYKEPDELIGEASRMEQTAHDLERQAEPLLAVEDDAYKQSEGNKMKDRATQLRDEATQLKSKAQEVASHLQVADREADSLRAQITDLERRRQSVYNRREAV